MIRCICREFRQLLGCVAYAYVYWRASQPLRGDRFRDGGVR